jgi:hypothetical protein
MNKNLTLNASKTNRSRIQTELYNYEFCKGIKTKKNLDNKLQTLHSKILIDKNNKKNKNIQNIKLLPYCGEKVHVSTIINKVNESSIDKDIIENINKIFTVKIEPEFINEGILEEYKTKKINSNDSKNISFRSIYNPEEFKNLIENKQKLDTILNKKKHMFVVVHGNFLKQFAKLYGHMLTFDNLDILQLTIYINVSKSINLINIYNRKFSENYEIKHKLRTDLVELHSKQFIKTNIYLMRHCVACHNIIDSKFNSKIIMHMFQKMQRELGFSKYSICSPYTIDELQNKSTNFLNIFNTECDGIENIQFCSSVIFRAILTCTLLVKILFNKQIDKGYFKLISNIFKDFIQKTKKYKNKLF